MIGTLARKELHQHWRALVFLALLTPGALVLTHFGSQQQGGSGSVFEGLLALLRTLVPLACIVLSHRLVALEFREKTQLFVEALPLPRWWMIALKYFFGLAIVLLIAGVSFAAACGMARSSENLTPRFVSILAMRTAAWSWWVYCILFLTGFLGRYRVALYLITGFAVLAIVTLTELRVDEFGPFALVDNRFAYESTVLPVAALSVTGLLALVFTGLSFALGLVREGSVAALLGEKMSHREKIFLGAVVVACVVSLATFLERKPKEAFDLVGGVEEARGPVSVKVAVAPGGDARLSGKLAASAADELAAVREYLGTAELPPVFVVPRSELAAGHFERATLEDADGVLVRANFTSPEFQPAAFLPWLTREAVAAQNQGRTELEQKKWVFEGFTRLWPRRAQATEPLASDPLFAEQAIRGAAKGFTASDLQRWLSYEKRIGEEDAKSVAWSLLKTLARRHGAEACRVFIQAALGQHITRDVRASWRDLRHPPARLLQSTTGVTVEQLVAEWHEEIASVRQSVTAP